MAHSLTQIPATLHISTAAAATKKKPCYPSLGLTTIRASHHAPDQCIASQSSPQMDRRRIIGLGLTGVLLGLNYKAQPATAAGRRPPPPPPKEKEDPNVSGALAKFIASKRRKEAMKAAMEKLREKGKPIS